MKHSLTSLATSALLLGSGQVVAQLQITNDNTFETAKQMLLANELFESGEPFAESLGYDLDLLDPTVLNLPDSISYTTGIEGYEYSRYLLNTLNGRSGLGLHVMWSPIIMANAAMQDASFDGTFTGGTPNGYKEDDMLMMMIGNFGANANQTPFANAFPQFADFRSGNNNLPQTVATDFLTDYATTRWDRSLMDKSLNPGAMGQSLWKQYFWAQDMLGAFHDGNNEGIDADGTNSPDLPDSPMFDPNNDIYYGGNNVDGFIGQVLTAVSVNKTMFLISQLAYDGTTLGAVDPASYDPANGIQYFPTRIGLTESMVLAGLPPQATNLTVLDATSQLFDQWSFLLGTTGYKNMMNPDDDSDAAHLAYHEVFDGFPFPASMSETGTPGPFDLMTGASKVIFMNMMAMHFNATEGTFVDESGLDGMGSPTPGNSISAANAAYTLVALAKFADEFGGTPLQGMANNALIAQADFIIANMKDPSGGFYNSYTIGAGPSNSNKTLAANAALVRGLYTASAHTGNTAYLTAANEGYDFLINNFYLPSERAFRTELADNTATYTPEVLAYLAGALREASLIGPRPEAAAIYTRVFKHVYNAMLLSEAEVSGETGSDSDGDGIPYIAGGNKPFVFAAEATLLLNPLSVTDLASGLNSVNIYPNPAVQDVYMELAMERSGNVAVEVFDVRGQLVKQISGSDIRTGSNKLQMNITGFGTGSYFVRILVDGEIAAIEKLMVNGR